MLEQHLIDKMVDFLKRKYQDRLEVEIGTEEQVKQYLAYHFLHGTLMWVNNKEEGITGILVSYNCDEDEVGDSADFKWELPKGENCIFVAELVADDVRSRNLLAHGFLQRYPIKKKSYAKRHGRIVEIKAHDISQSFTKDIYGR